MYIHIYIYIYLLFWRDFCKNCKSHEAGVVSTLYFFFCYAREEGLFHCQRTRDKSANKSSQQVGLRARLFLGVNSNQLSWLSVNSRSCK